jgi:hypothetical protein
MRTRSLPGASRLWRADAQDAFKEASCGISIFRLAEGRIADRWEQLDRPALTQRLGVVPAPGVRARPGYWGVEALISAPLSSPSSSSRCSSPAPCLCGSTTRQRAACCGGIFHASLDAVINQLSYDVVPAANAAKFLIFSAVIVLAATTVISLRDSCLDAALARSLLTHHPRLLVLVYTATN